MDQKEAANQPKRVDETDIPRCWTFKDEAVAAGFDRHVREQLPWYDLATGVVAHIARHYVQPGALVYDVGASTGNIGRALRDVLHDRGARLVAIDNSNQMADLYRGPGDLVIANAEDYTYEPFGFAICFLVLMFLDPESRDALLRRLLGVCRPGGAIVVFDKEAPVGGYQSIVMWRLALAGKRAAGISDAEIVSKELSLGGVQRPLEPGWLARMGGREFFRFGDFVGYLFEVG